MKSETIHTKEAFINNFYNNTEYYYRDEKVVDYLAEKCMELEFDRFYTYFDSVNDYIDIHIYKDDTEIMITWWFDMEDNVNFTLSIYEDKNHFCSFEGPKEVLDRIIETISNGYMDILSIMYNNWDEIKERVENEKS